MNSEKNICIIGCGVAGLAALRVFSEEVDGFPINYSLVGFEKRNCVGGLWNYDDGSDSEFISPIYRDMKTNIPKEIMCYPDFPFVKQNESFLHHKDVLKYLQDYAKLYNLEKYIKFNSEVINVDAVTSGESQKWKVRIKNSISTFDYLFDIMVICNGHFEKPRVPQIRGLTNFTGECLHSMYFRFPEIYLNKTVFVLGAKSSGIDISLQLVNFADQVYLSHSGASLGWTKEFSNLEETSRISYVDIDGKIILVDGSKYEADIIIFCTGYEIDLSFLNNSIGLESNNSYVRPLYKDFINPNFPTNCFLIGIGFEFLPTIHSYLQCKVARSIVQNCYKDIILSRENLFKQIQKEQEEFIKNNVEMRHRHLYNVKEWSYFKWCCNVAENIMTYKIPDYLENMYRVVLELRFKKSYDYKKIIFQLDENSEFGFVIKDENDFNLNDVISL